ncbi:hypothetical protein D3C83_00020 [compost metagenome]
MPCLELEPGQAGIGSRRQVRKRGRALQAADGEGAQTARLDHARRLRDVGEGDLDFPAHHRGERRAAALEMDRHDGGTAEHVEQLAGDVRVGADARGAVVEPSRARLGEIEQLLHRAHRDRRMHRDRHRDLGQQRNRREILHGIVAGALVEDRAGDERDRVHEQRVAVGCAAHGDARADLARGAAAVVDDDLLSEQSRELVGDRARVEVRAAARRERHDHAYRLGRVGLRLRVPGTGQGGGRQDGGKQAKANGTAAGTFHCSLLRRCRAVSRSIAPRACYGLVL